MLPRADDPYEQSTLPYQSYIGPVDALLTGTGTNKHNQLQVQIDIRVDASGQVAGTIATGSAIPAGSGTSI